VRIAERAASFSHTSLTNVVGLIVAAGIVPADARCQPPELLIRDAEYVIEQPSLDWNGVERLSVVFVGHIQCDADTASATHPTLRMTDVFSPYCSADAN
jgi:hypothetical protein